jgi:Na+/proline symporter
MRLSWIDLTIVIGYVAASMISTGLGLVTIMHFAEEGFRNGFAPFIIGVIAAVTQMVIGRTGFIISRLRHLRVMTVPEFYEIKYSRGVRLLGGCILAIAGTINMGLFPILGSKFVVGFTGLPQESVNYVMIAVGRAVIPMLWGAAALAYFNDPGHDGQSAMPEMMGALLPVGLAGILLAGMFAAFMSTHDSYLLAWSGVIVRDVISPLRAIFNGDRSGRGVDDDTWGGLSSTQQVLWTRIVVVLLAAFLGIFGIYYIDRMPETAFKFMFITGTLYMAGTVGTVALGLYWKRANTPGSDQLPHHEPLPGIGARFSGPIGRKLQSPRPAQLDSGGTRHGRGCIANPAIAPSPATRFYRYGVGPSGGLSLWKPGK